MSFQRRAVPAHQFEPGTHPVLGRVLAARGIINDAQHERSLSALLPPDRLKDIDTAVSVLIEAIDRKAKVVIAGDYDADGATAVAVAMLGLRMLGLEALDYVVPNRLTMGYGLSPQLAEMAAQKQAGVLITVDNGIASLSGVACAKQLGMRVVVTDHHLPGEQKPAADAIVNPNQADCSFPSKCLSGVGVVFYLLMRLRQRLRDEGRFAASAQPALSSLLDLVALGTVADLVPLDQNNRILVHEGLRRMRSGRLRPGLSALLGLAGREPSELSASDLGFALGPRINAAGRLDDMRIGIECLLAPDRATAEPLAKALDDINRSRRQMQAQMSEEALAQITRRLDADQIGICVHDADWHEGIVGLVASKVKEVMHRPVVALAPAQEDGMLKGSARTIDGLHLRDALAAIDSAHPGMLDKFGGHAMAAGLSLRAAHLQAFGAAFNAHCKDVLSAEALQRRRWSDGALLPSELNLETALAIQHGGPWGQGIPAPLFDDPFEVLDARVVGADQRHVRYRLRADGHRTLTAIHFGGVEQIRRQGGVHALYGLEINRWQGRENLELRIEELI
ncbi:MAG: single-stranded-DNA-specific exonuclease RecJ [Panacagrimonas sp.]